MAKVKDKKDKKKKNNISTFILIIVFIIGICLLCYPFVSNLWNTRTQSRAINNYKETVEEFNNAEYEKYFDAADKFNAQIRKLGSEVAITEPELLDGYEDVLNVSGSGIMGYVTIEKINVNLPIYHGTDSSVLNLGAGHLEGTSLPVGGKGTHCVISAHRGFPSALLFTNLDKMEIGDTFTITVLDRVLTYEVDNISIILPDEIENIFIDEDEDYCTLMTCTPYGINTHRLLVRGVRIDTENTTAVHISSDAYKIDTFTVACIAAVPIFVILLIWLIAITHRRKRRSFEDDENEIV